MSILVRHCDERSVGDVLRIIFLNPRENPDNLALSNLDVIYEHEIKSHLENQNKNSSAGFISDGSGENCDSSSAIDSTGLDQGLSYASQSLGGYSSRIDQVADIP